MKFARISGLRNSQQLVGWFLVNHIPEFEANSVLWLLLNANRKPYSRNALVCFQTLRVVHSLGPWPHFGFLEHVAILLQSCVRLTYHTTNVVNEMRLSRLVDNINRWTLFTALDRA